MVARDTDLSTMTHTSALLVFPHQLFFDHPGLSKDPDVVVLLEDSLFFGDAAYPLAFHKQKLWFHRATMTRYAALLRERGLTVRHVEHRSPNGALASFLASFAEEGGTEVVLTEPHDFLLEKRLDRLCARHAIQQVRMPTPMFLNRAEDNHEYRSGKRRWFMADFYKHQRRRLQVLMDEDKPMGGQWSFDKDNRKKVPKALRSQIPSLPEPVTDDIDEAARRHVEAHYPDHPGSLNDLIYPTSHAEAVTWLDRFIEERFAHFGEYEDALLEGESFLWHSVLTPMLNTGLLTPKQVLDAIERPDVASFVPLNSREGFVRQIIGWREFIRATYEDLGVTMRTTNHWAHHRPLSPRFYNATTGIPPVDDVIRRSLQTGYCHHIERLMVLGGFMFLCELDPDHIYRWFMEMYVDSYDWVMVPNVYAMSQNADGGLITTKPYFSGSAYIRKMGNYPKGPWTQVWDGLYWRWILKHHDALAKNPRWAMMCATARRMSAEKKAEHLHHAETFLASL